MNYSSESRDGKGGARYNGPGATLNRSSINSVAFSIFAPGAELGVYFGGGYVQSVAFVKCEIWKNSGLRLLGFRDLSVFGFLCCLIFIALVWR